MQNQNGFIHLILIIIITATLLSVGGYFFVAQIPSPIIVEPDQDTKPNPNPSPIACTQEAKQCPDGSYVGRNGPNCEFAQCPVQNPAEGEQITMEEGQRDGSLLVQKIYPTYITGLNFWEYPVATDKGHPITLYIGQTASNGCTVQLTLIDIDKNKAIFIKKTDFSKPCPICLAENTLIDTPSGQIAVQDLKHGMTVWTVNQSGERIASAVVKTSKTPVPTTHQMVHIILDDGREIFASPGHPVGDGRVFGGLSIGQILDNSKIVIAEKTTYDKSFTYDILPAGQTGLYFAGHNTAPGFANGILIGSTLK